MSTCTWSELLLYIYFSSSLYISRIHYPPLLHGGHLIGVLCKYKCSTSRNPCRFQFPCMHKSVQNTSLTQDDFLPSNICLFVFFLLPGSYTILFDIILQASNDENEQRNTFFSNFLSKKIWQLLLGPMK